MSILARLVGVFKGSPVFVASLQAGSLMCVGDAISQKVIEKREKLDLARNARFGLIGFCMVGPVLRAWYGFLERRIVIQSRGKSAVAKMCADQLAMAPVFLFNFIGVNSLLQGNSLETVKQDITSSYVDILISNYQIWPAVQMINFFAVPLQYRVLFVQTVAVAWNTYLSWKTSSTSTQHKTSEKASSIK